MRASLLRSPLLPPSQLTKPTHSTMNSAQATFFYGVFVKAAHLCFASDAYKATKGSLLAIDLICARRRKGTLQGQYQTLDGVTRVPEEVWRMIELEIINVGLHEAEQSLLRSCFMNKDCDHAVAASWHELESSKLDCCIEHFWDIGGMEQMLQDRIHVSSSNPTLLEKQRTSPLVHVLSGCERVGQRLWTRHSLSLPRQQRRVSSLGLPSPFSS